ncbi:MAG: hypothetical protein ACKOQ8_05530 [Micrococcales bacterium]
MPRSFIAAQMASVRKRFQDTFNRSTSGIGTATDGSAWTTLKGTYNVSGGIATATDANYPMVVQDMPYSDAHMLVAMSTNGSSGAFWVTDANNWWAAGLEQTTVNCNCTNYTYCSSTGCTGYGCTATGCTAYTCSSYICVAYGCLGYGCSQYSRGNCIAYGCALFAGYGCLSYACNGYSCSTYGCTATGCTTYGCTAYAVGTTCDTCYPRSIRILQSVANVVSTVTAWTLSSAAGALRIKTKGNQIKISAYTDQPGTSLIDSEVTYTPSSPTITKKFGLVVAPASYNQGNSFTGITIDQN